MTAADEPDWETLADLVEFARIEIASADIEPWAEMFAELHRSGFADREQSHWLIALYNSYDSLGSAMSCFRRWPSPQAWRAAADRDDAAEYECTQERRNLRGGKVLLRHQSYVDALAGQSQHAWVSQVVCSDDPAENFRAVTTWVRQVWGVGRQSAFEWAEFVGKVFDLPVEAGDAQLWESEGPRRSLQRLYGNPAPTAQWLEDTAKDCKQHLADQGVELDWWDFETVICDFNVMRDGRYYPGRHLAAIREEIAECDEADAEVLSAALRRFVPPDWQGIPPGIDKAKLPIYRDTGEIVAAA